MTHAEHFRAQFDGRAHYGAHGGVHSRGVSPAGQHGNSLDGGHGPKRPCYHRTRKRRVDAARYTILKNGFRANAGGRRVRGQRREERGVRECLPMVHPEKLWINERNLELSAFRLPLF
jgi:hypothetical protein